MALQSEYFYNKQIPSIPLTKIEIQAIERVGFDYIKSITQAVMTFNKALKQAMEEDN